MALALFIHTLASLQVTPKPVRGHDNFLAAALPEPQMQSVLRRWCLEETFRGEHRHAKDFRDMSEWPVYLNAYESRACLGLFRSHDDSRPVCVVQMQRHLSSHFFVTALAIPEHEIGQASEIFDVLAAMGMCIALSQAHLHFTFPSTDDDG